MAGQGKINEGRGKKIEKLTLQFIPFSEIENLSSGNRIKRLLRIVLTNKIVLLQGRLRPEEEVRLIEDTMAMIDHVPGFKGIELAVLSSKNKNVAFFDVLRSRIAKLLIGDREAITIIGPASLVREIKRDPSKIELLLGKK